MSFKATDEQKKIFHFIKNRKENLLIGALAGAGKTTTVVRGAELLPKDSKKIYLAFNKHIQMELKERLPDDVYCYTFHGLGMSAIKNTYGDSIKFDEFKVDNIVKKKSKRWGLDKELLNYQDRVDYLTKVKKFVNLCRQTVTLDKKYLPHLSTKYDIELDEPKDHKRVFSVLEEMLNDRRTFDFTDMVFLPAIDNKIWTYQYDYVMVDECFPYNQYISTEIGKKKIGTLYNMHLRNEKLPMVETFSEKNKSFEKKKITNIWTNGVKDVYEVIVGGKRKIKSTNNHKFLTIDGWKNLGELKVGDAILSNYQDQPYHSILNELQKDIFIGSILGDGSLNEMSINIKRLRVQHGEDQKEYIKWKGEFFGNKIKNIKNNGYSNKPAYSFTTKGYYFNIETSNMKNIINEITLKSLAISWMDDGSISNKYNSSRLYSCATSENLSKYLSQTIENKWGIKSTIKSTISSSTKKPYFWLLFNKEDTEKLSKLISPFIHKSMEYKICPEHRKNIDNINWNKPLLIEYGCMIVTRESKFKKKELVFDMEVEDNHNFIITSSSYNKNSIAKNYGLIAHNCQDLNRAQQYIIKKILKRDRISKKVTGRLIAVGDYYQSIYGFSGVSDKSFDWFRKFPNTKTLPLTTTFRCAKNIVEEARKIVPTLQALPNAIEGIVREGSVLDEPESGDFVLCRTTTPLIKLFFHYLLQGKKAVIKGSDIGVSLEEMIQGHKSLSQLMAHYQNKLNDYQVALRKRGILNYEDDAGYIALEDNVMALNFMAKLSTDIADLKKKVKMIFTDDLDGIVLSTVHKSKGLEAERVFIARPDKMPLPTKKAWQHAQEMNLKYVAITRAKSELVFDHKWVDDDQEGEIE